MLDIALTEPVFRLARSRLAHDVPMAIERAAVPLRFSGRAELDRDSLYPGCETADFRRVRAMQRLRGVAAGAAGAHRVAYAADGRQVEFTRGANRSDTNDFVGEPTVSPSARARIEGAAR